MGGKKPKKHCGYNREHKSHVWEEDGKYGRSGRRLFCEGSPVKQHVHVWDRQYAVRTGYDEHNKIPEGDLVNGPFQCKCGKSRWLVDGRAEEERFPQADALDRIVKLKAKVDAGGPESLSERDKEELERIAAEIVRILTPLMEQLQKIGEMIVQMIQGFLDSLSPETIAYLSELGKSIGEKPDEVETVSLMGSDGEVIATAVVSHDPIAAVAPTELLSDEDQQRVIEEAYDVDSPQMSFPIPDGVAIVKGIEYDLNAPSVVERRGLGHVGGIGHEDLVRRLSQ